MLIGTHDWEINNDFACSAGGSSARLKLSLTSCSSNTFNCDDGTCIDLEKRCDGSCDCPDESDENNCTRVLYKPGYNKDVTPISSISAVKKTVGVSLHFSDILGININSGTVSLKLTVLLEWTDSRLSFLNLKTQRSLNVLSNQEYDSIWKPQIIYANKEPSDQQQYVNLEPEVSVGINSSHSPILWDSEFVYVAKEYPGDVNSLQWTTVIR